MYLLMINLTMGMLLLMCPCAIFGQDAIDAEIRDEMMALHPDVRMPGLAAIRRNHNLSDDEFSERLVKLATVTTNGDDATLRMFTVAALGDFGTTNALDFLEKEVRRGNVGAISEYGAISGYDDTFWRLATLMTSDLGKPNYRCRFTVYCAMRPILKDESCSSKYYITFWLFVLIHSDFISKKRPLSNITCILFAKFINHIHYLIQKKALCNLYETFGTAFFVSLYINLNNKGRFLTCL